MRLSNLPPLWVLGIHCGVLFSFTTGPLAAQQAGPALVFPNQNETTVPRELLPVPAEALPAPQEILPAPQEMLPPIPRRTKQPAPRTQRTIPQQRTVPAQPTVPPQPQSPNTTWNQTPQKYSPNPPPPFTVDPQGQVWRTRPPAAGIGDRGDYRFSNYGLGGYGLGGYGLQQRDTGAYGLSTLGWGNYGSPWNFTGYSGYGDSSSYNYGGHYSPGFYGD